MNVSEHATEDINLDQQVNLINTSFKVFSFLNMAIVASSIFDNVLIIIVVTRDKATTTSILFGILAGTDILATCMVPLFTIIKFLVPRLGEYFNSVVVFAYWAFVRDTIGEHSTWTLVVITKERFLSVTMPFTVKEVVTVRSVILAEISTSITVMVVQYLRNILAVEYVNGADYINHSPRSYTWSLFFDISDWVCFAGIPLIIIITASLVIWIKLRKSFAQRPTQSGRIRSVTAILLMANFTFLITNIPFRILKMIIYFYFGSFSLTMFQLFTIERTVAYLRSLNHALNFNVYIFSGQKFREDVKRLFSSLTMRKNIK